MQPAAVQAQGAVFPTQEDFIRKYVEARGADARAHPTSLWNAITGRGTDAAKAMAEVEGPAAFLKMLSVAPEFQNAQNTATSGQLGLLQRLAQTGLVSGQNVDPNNVMTALPKYTEAMRAQFPEMAPRGSVPAGEQGNTQTPSAAAPANPLDAQRRFFDMLGRLQTFTGDATGAKNYFDLARSGLTPEMGVAIANGSAVDAISGQPISGNVNERYAGRAGAVARAQGNEQITTQNKIDDHATSNRMMADTHSAETGAKNKVLEGVDPRTGLPTTATEYDVAHGVNPNFVKSNPYFKSQQDELKTLRDDAQIADNGLILAQEIMNAANGVYTGKGAETAQDIRKIAQAMSSVTGVPLDPSWNENASKIEQMKYAAQQIVAAASHDVNPRAAAMIYKAIEGVKPGEASSMQGLRDIIAGQIVPALSRRKALFNATSDYYRQNPMRNDATSVVGDKNPLSNFAVKTDLGSVQPGEFFIHPETGELLRRPQ
jgi:hypothetical protein